MADRIFDWNEIIFCKYYKKTLSNSERSLRSVLYDILYEKADLILARYDPCSFKKSRCLRGISCCTTDDKCRYLKSERCSVKALACKLWLCDEAKEKFPECAIALDTLALVAKEYDLLATRKSKKDIL